MASPGFVHIRLSDNTEELKHTLFHFFANLSDVDQMNQSPDGHKATAINPLQSEEPATFYGARVAPARKAQKTRDPWRDYVIPSDRYKFISQCHNTKVGHFKVNLTMERVQKLRAMTPSMEAKFGNWTTAELRRDVTSFIKNCPCCQKMNVLRPAIHAHPYTTSTWGVFDNLAIDVITGLPTSEEGYSNLMVIVDTFSRYIELHPMGTLTALNAAKALELWMSRYGRPLNILTDNASQFQAHYEATLEALGIQNDKIHPYSHEENAIVERANKEVLRHLRDILYDTKVHSKWADHIPAIQRIKNSTRVMSTGMAPAELVFGTSYRLEAGVLYPHDTTNIKSVPMREYIQRQHTIQLQALQAAYKLQDLTDHEHLAATPAVRETEYDIGSLVLVQYENDAHRPPTKVHPKLRGPFKVTAVTHRDSRGSIYTCQNLATNKLEDFHVKLLQKFNYDPRFTDPAIEALVDSELFVVEAILDHVFDGKRKLKSELKFKVKWLGYDETTWEPYANVAKVKILHDYLRAHHMESFLQEAFQEPKASKPTGQKRVRIEPEEDEDDLRRSNRPRKRKIRDD